MSITEELRGWAFAHKDGTRIDTESYGYDRLIAIADRIEAKLEDYIPLPKDADGQTIRVGDRLDGYNKTVEVVELRYGRSGWVLISRDGNAYADTFAFAHAKPDSWERIVGEVYALGYEDGEECSTVQNNFDYFVERCKRLAGDAE